MRTSRHVNRSERCTFKRASLSRHSRSRAVSSSRAAYTPMLRIFSESMERRSTIIPAVSECSAARDRSTSSKCPRIDSSILSIRSFRRWLHGSICRLMSAMYASSTSSRLASSSSAHNLKLQWCCARTIDSKSASSSTESGACSYHVHAMKVYL